MGSSDRVAHILSTGDGSFERPYVVNSVAEEYLVLKYHGKTPLIQALMESSLDRITCKDGTTYYFDIQSFFPWNEEKDEPPGQPPE